MSRDSFSSNDFHELLQSLPDDSPSPPMMSSIGGRRPIMRSSSNVSSIQGPNSSSSNSNLEWSNFSSVYPSSTSDTSISGGNSMSSIFGGSSSSGLSMTPPDSGTKFFRENGTIPFEFNGREVSSNGNGSGEVTNLFNGSSTLSNEGFNFDQPNNGFTLMPPPPPRAGRGAPLQKNKVIFNHCVFCRNNGEREEFCVTHTLRDDNGKVSCPVLKKYICPICGATGRNAHTIKYCPKNRDGKIFDRHNRSILNTGISSPVNSPKSIFAWSKEEDCHNAAWTGSGLRRVPAAPIPQGYAESTPKITPMYGELVNNNFRNSTKNNNLTNELSFTASEFFPSMSNYINRNNGGASGSPPTNNNNYLNY